MTEKSNLRKILAKSGLLGLHRTKNVDLRESGLVRWRFSNGPIDWFTESS